MARERFSGLGRTSFFMFGIIGFTKALGFFREVLLTHKFGASEETDAFYLVFAIVVLVASLMMSETPRVLVPRFLQVQGEKGERAALSLIGGSTFWLVLVSTLAGLALYFGADLLISLVAPEFGDEQAALAARMVRILSACAPACALVGPITALARARGHFYLVQVALMGMTVGTLAGILLWSDSMGIAGAALGLMLGLVGAGGVMGLYLALEKIFPRTDSEGLRGGLGTLGLVVPLILVSSHGGYLAVVVDRYFSALLEPGHFSCLGYAYRLLVVPLQVLYGAMAVALLPALADRVADGDHDEVERMVGRALRMLLLMMGPLICGLAVFGEPVVGLAFGRGAFGMEWIELTALLMICQVPVMLCEILRQPLATVYFAHGRARMPVAFGLLRVFLLLAIYPLVWREWGAVGLALGMGVADIIVVVTMAILARRLFNLRLPGMLLFSAKLLLVTGLVLTLAGGAWAYVDSYLILDSFFERLVGLSVAAVFCGGGLLLGTRLIGMAEGSQLVGLVVSILRRSKST
jgi:putative peptidoglycan lipid II flippase